MFTNPKFKEIISCFTLRFKNKKLEEFYKSSREDNYLRRLSPFYMIQISVVVINAITAYMTYDTFMKGNTDAGMASIIAYSIIAFGIALEILVNFSARLRSFRTVPTVISIFTLGSIVNSHIDKTPLFRPG